MPDSQSEDVQAPVVFISGLFSGPNPSPGLGTARSIRQAFPNAKLVGVDYSVRSTGIHWPDFDEIWLQRPWDELDLDLHREQIRNVLDSGAIWISGLDLEALWLSRTFRAHPNLLVPPEYALREIRKPAVGIAAALGFKSPPSLDMTESEWDVSAFCRQHDWKVWLKGPYYEARPVRSWRELLRAREELSGTWSVTDELFLQAHVSGHEGAVAMCASRGRLLAAAYMEKNEITEEGKTWAAQVSSVPSELDLPLRDLVARLRWTGGAEIEFVRDADGQRHLLEWNPRFPAWIHGATVAGCNLPAALVASLTSLPADPPRLTAGYFVRVVTEIPPRAGYPVMPIIERENASIAAVTKHPSGMPLLATRLHPLHRDQPGPAPQPHPDVMSELEDVAIDSLATPSVVFMRRTAELAFSSALQAARLSSVPPLVVRIAYSMKTNPDARVLRLALENGFLVEAISQLEARRALDLGFERPDVVLNGPGKWWPTNGQTITGGVVFADSIEEMESLVDLVDHQVEPPMVGPRLKLPAVDSRFGIGLSYPEMRRLSTVLQSLPTRVDVGVHFHIASSSVGITKWWSLCESALRWCRSLEDASGRAVRCLDLGGGWFPDDFQRLFAPRLPATARRVAALLPSARLLIVELGKAIVQNSSVLVVRVLEARRAQGAIAEVVVDGSIAELPEAHAFPHRVLFWDAAAGSWSALRRGTARVLGRLCMEDDVLAPNVHLPATIAKGDALIICDAGAYDRSMAYTFGVG